jgi:hypothetical protein
MWISKDDPDSASFDLRWMPMLVCQFEDIMKAQQGWTGFDKSKALAKFEEVIDTFVTHLDSSEE